ncbi:MAG: hypothetical protein ACKPKO_47960, partial [Candidatus Fonsibacter sp.]
MLTTLEKEGTLLEELDALCIAMLPKPDGGYRPIGILQSYIRFWGRVRRRRVALWEDRHAAREYFWGCRGRSAQAAVWAQCIEVEYARARKAHGASLLIDLRKAYELVAHQLAAWRARQAGFPLAIARMALLVYGGRRIVRVGRACAMPIRTTTGIVAGCSHANAFLKAVLLSTADSIVKTYGGVSLYIMVDDMTLTASGSKAMVEQCVGAAGRRLMLDL